MPAAAAKGRLTADDVSGSRSATCIVTPHARVSRLSMYLLIASVLTFLVYCAAAYGPTLGNGSDFQVFYAAAVADKHGVNPYDWPSLWRVQQQLFNGGVGHSLPFAFAPYADPPPFALLLRPFTGMSETQADHIWAALLVICCGLGAYLALYDWPRHPRLIASALVALCPASLFDLRLGQNSIPLLLSLGAAYRLMDRGKPFWSGLCLGCGMFKPHLMGPIILVAILAAPQEDRKRMALGGIMSGALAVAVGVLFDGGAASYRHWLAGLRQFGGTIRQQPDLASVAGFYQGNALETILNVVCLIAAAATIFMLLSRANGYGGGEYRIVVGGGIAVYLAFSPYVHTSDQILLAPGLLSLIGPSGEGLRDRAVLLAAWSVLLAPMVVIRDYHTTGINALPPITLALAYWLHRRTDISNVSVVHD